MKKITIVTALALIGLSSCTKEKDYLCTITQYNPETNVTDTIGVTPFRGTYYQMKAFEKEGTFVGINANSWHITTCK